MIKAGRGRKIIGQGGGPEGKNEGKYRGGT